MTGEHSIDFHCPKCNARLAAKKEAAGKEAACPNCKAKILVPMKSEASATR